MRTDYLPLRVSDGEYLYEGEFWLTIESVADELGISYGYASLLAMRWRRIEFLANRTSNALLYSLSDALHWARYERRFHGRRLSRLAWHPVYGPPKATRYA